MMEEKRKSGYRSLFWPIILIGIGVFMLLGNMDLLPKHSLWTLTRLWPLVLVVIGLDILIGRRSPFIGAAIGIGAISLAVVLVFAAPTLGIVPTGDVVITESFTEEIGSATSAEVNLKLSIGKTTISALSDSNYLFDGELTHLGEIKFDVQGDEHKKLTLRQTSVSYDFSDFGWFDTEDLEWDIGLSPGVPLSLNIDGSIGQSNFDFRGLLIEEVDIQGDVGETTLSLPATDKPYDVKIDGGVGKFTVSLEPETSVFLTIKGDVGDFTIDIPSDAAVRVDAEVDIGDLRIDSRLEKISGSDGDFLSESGVWETPGFSSADHQIVIVFDGSIGSLQVR
jgi:hypothetical protein